MKSELLNDLIQDFGGKTPPALRELDRVMKFWIAVLDTLTMKGNCGDEENKTEHSRFHCLTLFLGSILRRRPVMVQPKSDNRGV